MKSFFKPVLLNGKSASSWQRLSATNFAEGEGGGRGE